MLDLHMWNVITDMSLAIAVVVLCTRLMASKNTATRRAYALELSLRELIKEADAASKGFSDELQRKQQELHRLLSEMRTQEQRLLQVKEQLTSHRQAPVRHESMEHVQAARPQPTAARARQYQQGIEPEETPAAAPRPAPEAVASVKETVQEPPSFSRNRRALSRHVERINESVPARESQAVNIYGEPIGSVAEEAPTTMYQQQQPESAPVEESVEPLTPTEQSAIQELYDRAENMLRAGNDLQSVATVTRLSMEEVRLLSQMISREAAVDAEYVFEKGMKNGMNITV